MKQRNLIVRLLAVLLAFCFFTASSSLNIVASAEDDPYAGMTVEEKQAVIEQKLKEVDEKLDSLGEQSKETKEYIDTLDKKIGYLQKELTMSEQEIEQSKVKITSLEEQYNDNEEEIARMEIDLKDLEAENEALQTKFDMNYERFCQRIRAMYISGNVNVISMILTSPDISTLLTRLEMIKRVSMNDKELLQAVQNEAQSIIDTKNAMEQKQTSLAENQRILVETQKVLTTSITDLEKQQVSYQEKQDAYQSEKSESDALLKQLHDEQQTYSEYRNQDQAELDAVNEEIARAAEEFRKKMEEQTTTQPPTETTTKQETTNKPTQPGDTTTAPPSTTTTQPPTKPSNRLQMTYPVPSQTKITCDYGSAGYDGHTGVDFSCASGSAVVAAESGYVFYTKQLETSYGYHIVIMHDKTNSKGDYVYTLYAHNSSLLVSAGQYVKKGQTIAYSGSTGNSTGPHCHFEVRTPTAEYRNCVDPNIYLP